VLTNHPIRVVGLCRDAEFSPTVEYERNPQVTHLITILQS